MQWIQFNMTRYYIQSGHQYEQLTIKKQLFRDFPFVFWKFQLTGNLIITENVTSQGVTSKSFFVNYSPINGMCDVEPKNGTTSDIFNLFCLNWIDSEGFVTQYVYYGKI